MLSPEAPDINESLSALDHEMEEHLGESALTLFEELSKPLEKPFEITMGGTGNMTKTPFGKGTADDWDDWDD